MSEELILKLGQDTMKVTAMLSGPLLLAALIVGLVVSVFQAVTQINEATLTFIPKMIIVGLVLVLTAPWMLDVVSGFTVQIFENLGEMVRVR
ncbi:MAG: flagellar biosynthesis protein FliQ [Calothrix sp. SM1_5_4]|nr:flagellar biosynthesis protein FliQ [Calothrix sp. SM1_5_4]